jgi:hypothetical protein
MNPVVVLSDRDGGNTAQFHSLHLPPCFDAWPGLRLEYRRVDEEMIATFLDEFCDLSMVLAALILMHNVSAKSIGNA